MSITFHVTDAERDELIARAARDKVSISDYIRVRLGLRAQGAEGDADVQASPSHERTLHRQVADHELRLQALEGDRS